MKLLEESVIRSADNAEFALMKHLLEFKKVKLLILIFLVLSSLFIAYQYQNIKVEKESNMMAIKKMQLDMVRLEHKLLMKEFNSLIADVLIVKHTLEDDLAYLRAAEGFQRIVRSFSVLIANKGIYDQIRYIDENGNEVVRVEMEDDKVIIREDEELQNKANRYYFIDAMATQNGQVYVSKLDLNVERGRIETPLKPMIRIATKVFDGAGNEKGLVVMNYCAEIMIDEFVEIAQNGVSNAYLLNNRTYWLANSDDAASAFAFMYDDRLDINFMNAHPLAYHEIFNNGKVYFETANDIYFAKKVVPFTEKSDLNGDFSNQKIVLGDGALTIVLHVQKDKVSHIYFGSAVDVFIEILEQNIGGFFAIFVISILLTVLLQLYDKHKSSLKYYSEIDQATEVFNRRAGLEKSLQLIKKTRSSGINAGIIFVDVNGLKLVNDNLGHKYGDQLIKMAAKIMKDTIRHNDILFRYGGDEFIMCLEKIDRRGAEVLWSRIMANIDEVNQSNQYKFNISLSHGVSIIMSNEKNIDIKRHIEEADQNMYVEKMRIKKMALIVKAQ